jgi:5-methylcytosine-specific restriction enzyme subunit McrC
VADWNIGDTLLETTEHKTILAAEGLVDEFPASMWEALGLGVSRRLGGEAGLWEVSADRYVGVAQLRSGAARAQLRIHPKIDADIFFLADYAFGAERDLLADRQLTAELNAIRPDPAACLLAWYLAELETSCVGGYGATTSCVARCSTARFAGGCSWTSTSSASSAKGRRTRPRAKSSI